MLRAGAPGAGNRSPGAARSAPILRRIESPGTDTDEASLTRARGEELLEALTGRLPSAEARSGIAAALAEAAARALGSPDPGLIREAARLHEIGKLYVPAELLARPPAELSPAEWGLVSSHYEQGMALASGAGVPHRACALILHARESYDGSGPGGLQKDEIPLGSRVIAAAAEYLDAPLRAGAPAGDPREIAIERLEELSSSRLDPEVARVAVEAAGGAAG